MGINVDLLEYHVGHNGDVGDMIFSHWDEPEDLAQSWWTLTSQNYFVRHKKIEFGNSNPEKVLITLCSIYFLGTLW